MRTLIIAVGQEVPVSKKVYVEFLWCFGTEIQTARRESQAASGELDVQKERVGELELKGQILAHAAKKAADL